VNREVAGDRFFGVAGGHISRPGGPGTYKPNGPNPHKGIDVWAPPMSSVYVPLNADVLHIIRTDYNARGQAFGWIDFCGIRYGIAMAHFAVEPVHGTYLPGAYIGRVAGRVPWTPHIHFALARTFIPPQEGRDNVDPLKVWRECAR
jgi:hypothetical protein